MANPESGPGRTYFTGGLDAVVKAANRIFNEGRGYSSEKEQREYENLTKEMADLEEEKKNLTEALNSETDYQKLHDMGNRLQEIKDLLDEKELRWLELDEIGG